MSRTVQQFLQALVDAKVLSTGESAAIASSLTPEQRQSDATKFARRLVESKKLTETQAATALQPDATPAASAAAGNDDLSVMLGIQPLRGVSGRTTPSDSSPSVTPVAASHTTDDDGLSMMLGNKPLRGLAGPKPPANHNPTSGAPTTHATSRAGATPRLGLIIGAAAVVLLAILGWLLIG